MDIWKLWKTSQSKRDRQTEREKDSKSDREREGSRGTPRKLTHTTTTHDNVSAPHSALGPVASSLWTRRWRRQGVRQRVRSISLAWLPCQKLPVRYSSQKFYSWRKQYSKFCLLISRQLSVSARRSRSEVRAAAPGPCLAPGVGRHAASASVQLPDQLSVCLTDTLTHTPTHTHAGERFTNAVAWMPSGLTHLEYRDPGTDLLGRTLPA